MPLQATSGAASYDAFGGGVAAVPNYIEECFSAFLYTGNGSTQTITNGIDLSTKGGLVWWKNRTNATGHGLIDTTRGIDYYLSSNTTDAQDGPVSYISSVSSTGYSIGAGTQFVNQSANNYASWTFRKQPKFFDVVTYTGNGVNNRAIPHNLGSTPGCVITKRLNTSSSWRVQHRSINCVTVGDLRLDSTEAAGNPGLFFPTQANATDFFVSSNSEVNASGSTYVAYLFAHNAGGFGLSGTDNVISCGSFTTGGTGAATVTLGYEPQWVMIKRTDDVNNWIVLDTMRGWAVSSNDLRLNPNLSAAESADSLGFPTATGFQASGFGFNQTWIYIAIRRGPMKVPTSGTSVFSPVAYTGDGGSPKAINAGFVGDAAWGRGRTDTFNWNQVDRLRGSPRLSSNATSAEATSIYGNPTWDTMTGLNGVNGGTDNSNYNQSSMGYIFDVFKRAPSFFDVVCYTGTGSARTINHNLGVAPEMIICKVRVSAGSWAVWHSGLTSIGYAIFFSSSAQSSQPGCWNSTLPTSSVFSVGNAGETNQSTETFVSYLFATCAGVSKVGSYTGTGTTLQVNCGFTGGARFVLIKRTDSTGDWYVWDSARGIVAGNDPYLLLNSTAAEVTSTDYIDTYSAGFEISSTAPAAINASGGTFIFLAIA